MYNNKKYFYALGTMSGTSFDGVDAAIIKTDGLDYIKRLSDKQRNTMPMMKTINLMLVIQYRL